MLPANPRLSCTRLRKKVRHPKGRSLDAGEMWRTWAKSSCFTRLRSGPPVQLNSRCGTSPGKISTVNAGLFAGDVAHKGGTIANPPATPPCTPRLPPAMACASIRGVGARTRGRHHSGAATPHPPESARDLLHKISSPGAGPPCICWRRFVGELHRHRSGRTADRALLEAV
jgi:hypothetical protein